MKVFISADMEGVTGVTTWEDVTPGTESYNRFRKLMTWDVNAAIEGALNSGADEIIVNDAHRNMKNILIEEIHSEAQLISGSEGKELCMMEGINSTVDAVFLIGYHSKAGTTAGVLHHSLSSYAHTFKLNGVLIGESGLSAAIAGDYGVPVILVTGDDKVSTEIRELIPSVETAIVKKGISRYAAQCLSPSKACQIIKDTASKALDRLAEIKPYKVPKPVFEIEFVSVEIADLASTLTGIERVNPHTILHESMDMVSGFKTIWSALQLCTQAETRQGR